MNQFVVTVPMDLNRFHEGLCWISHPLGERHGQTQQRILEHLIIYETFLHKQQMLRFVGGKQVVFHLIPRGVVVKPAKGEVM